MESTSYSLATLQAAFARGEVQPQAYFDACIARINELNPTLQAFTSKNQNTEFLPQKQLSGIPIAYKDVFCETDELTQANSKMLEGFRPPYTATIVSRLKDVGVRSIGKTAMDEFAMGGSGENSATNITKNPHDIERIPGGSSSGSAAAVAAGMVPAAL
jgi:aspartyl-tRNA(Asn)/glutamyl-tRNA(Gln) amidotransferase subunit A